MKRLLIALVFSLVSSPVWAAGMEFFHGTFDEALAEAKKQKKLLFVDVYTDWCGPCKMMSADVFPSDVAGDFYNVNFINYKLDAEKGEGPDVTERYPVSGYPTFWFIDGNGELVKQAAGGMDAKIFVELGREALGQGLSYEEMQAKYDTGAREVKLIQAMLLKAPLYGQKFEYGSEESRVFWEGVSKMSQEYVASRKPSELINAEDFAIIKTYMDGPNRGQPVPELVFKRYDDFVKVVPESDVAMYVARTNNQTIHELSRNGDIGYKKYVEEIRTNPAIIKTGEYQAANAEPGNKFAKLSTYDVMSMVADGSYAISQKDWMGFVKKSEQYIKLLESVGVADAMNYINSTSHLLAAKCDDQIALERIEKMARKAYEMDSNSTHVTSTYGKLLAAIGEKAKAKDVLTKSLPMYTGRLERMKPEIEDLIKTL